MVDSIAPPLPNAAPVPSALRHLVRQAVENCLERGEGIEVHRRRLPLISTHYDDRFTTVSSFDESANQVLALPDVSERYGEGEAKQLVLRFLYAYFDQVPALRVDEACLEQTWSLFYQELSTPEWRHVAFTPLQNFTYPMDRQFDIAHDVHICPCQIEGDLAPHLGPEEFQCLREDRGLGAYASYALIVEHREPKCPENTRRLDSSTTLLKLKDALLALRLSKEGDLKTGRFFFCRPTVIPGPPLFRSLFGSASWRPGDEYHMDDHDERRLQERYALVRRFKQGSPQSWGNVTVALHRFASVFENEPNQGEDEVIDAAIALEALLGTDQEITYRLSSRIAGILADDDDERVATYKFVKLFYETRSKIVHGGALKEKHQNLLQDRSRFIQLVRRLLMAFLQLATGNSPFNSRKSIQDIDTILLDARERDELRQAMGLGNAGAA